MKLIHIGMIALLVVSGCEKTRYAPGLSREKFDQIELGDSLEVVLTLLGEPIVSYKAKNPIGRVALPSGELFERVEFENLRDVASDPTLSIILNYSSQENPSWNWYDCSVVLVGGVVTKKVWELVRE